MMFLQQITGFVESKDRDRRRALPTRIDGVARETSSR